MSMPLRFRAWNKKHKEMLTRIEIAFLNPLGEKSSSGKEAHELIQSKDQEGTLVERFGSLDDLIIMQSTGIFDKNGQEIYEGDIVLHKDFTKGVYFVVNWDNAKSCFAIEIRNVEGPTPYNLRVLGGGQFMEKVGNIYQYPNFKVMDKVVNDHRS